MQNLTTIHFQDFFPIQQRVNTSFNHEFFNITIFTKSYFYENIHFLHLSILQMTGHLIFATASRGAKLKNYLEQH